MNVGTNGVGQCKIPVTTLTPVQGSRQSGNGLIMIVSLTSKESFYVFRGRIRDCGPEKDTGNKNSPDFRTNQRQIKSLTSRPKENL